MACPQVDLTDAIAAYQAKRDLMVGILRQRFELGSPDGAFYLFVKAPDGWGGTAFAEYCVSQSVLVIPGAVFSERDSHFRVCYTVDDDTLRRGAERLCELADVAPPPCAAGLG